MEAITFRRVTRDDFGLIGRWLSAAHVSRWWNHEHSPEAVERDFGPSVDGTEPSQDFLVLLGRRPVGLIQYSTFSDYPEYVEELSPWVDVPGDAATIDYLIGDTADTGRGIGTRIITEFTRHVWSADPSPSCIIVPVSAANVASWRALQRAGFHDVAEADLEPDNPIDDRAHVILRLERPHRDDRPSKG